MNFEWRQSKDAQGLPPPLAWAQDFSDVEDEGTTLLQICKHSHITSW